MSQFTRRVARTVSSRFSIFCSVTIVACIVGYFLFAPRDWRPALLMTAAQRSEACCANLKQIGIALQAYHARYECFPPAYVVDAKGQKLHSWRVLLLPFLGHDDLYSKYRLDEPWNSPHNIQLANAIPREFVCPCASNSSQGETHYLAVVDRATAWPEQYSACMSDIFDHFYGWPTVQVMEVFNRPGICWLEPRDLSLDEACEMAASGISTGHGWIRSVDTDGELLRMGYQPEGFFTTLTINGGAPLARVTWPPDSPSAKRDFAEPRPATQLRRTDVLPYTAGEVRPGYNYVYCCSFQLAWQELMKAGKFPSSQIDQLPAMATKLMQSSFRTANVSEDCYIAVGGPLDREQYEAFVQNFRRRFPHRSIDLLPPFQSKEELLAFAYLERDLPFATEFDAIDNPLLFATGDNTAAVVSFGIKSYSGENYREKEQGTQVRILDYVGPDDFIVALKPADDRDEIVLAKVPIGPTLDDIISRVEDRIVSPNPRHRDKFLRMNDSLVVPNIEINTCREYHELYSNPEGIVPALAQATQVIQFRLDRFGAILRSDAMLFVEIDDAAPRKLIFDKPFLVLLREPDADQAYFAAWIANDELLEPFRD